MENHKLQCVSHLLFRWTGSYSCALNFQTLLIGYSLDSLDRVFFNKQTTGRHHCIVSCLSKCFFVHSFIYTCHIFEIFQQSNHEVVRAIHTGAGSFLEELVFVRQRRKRRNIEETFRNWQLCITNLQEQLVSLRSQYYAPSS